MRLVLEIEVWIGDLTSLEPVSLEGPVRYRGQRSKSLVEVFDSL